LNIALFSAVTHNHQVLIQTEFDENVKNSTFKLASKHPTQTTIVQMQKDGTYRVVYGSLLCRNPQPPF
jgi:hypothetical protein